MTTHSQEDNMAAVKVPFELERNSYYVQGNFHNKEPKWGKKTTTSK